MNITRGNLYVLPNKSTVAIEMLVLEEQHPDEDTVLMVPADDNTVFVGSCDLDVSADAGRPLVLRCGHCVSIPPKTIKTWTLVGHLPDQARNKVFPVLGKLASGRLIGTHEQLITDQDPEYQDHLDAITAIQLPD